MRIVLDTNVLIAAFVAQGACADLLEYCARFHELVSSEYILEEFRKNLLKKFHQTAHDALLAEDLLRQKMEMVDPIPVPRPSCRDPKDLPVLGTAVAGNSDALVTGDKDLLVLKNFKGVRIVSPQDFWRLERDEDF